MNVPDTQPRHVFIALALALALVSLSLGGGLPQFLLLHREHMTCVNHESKLLGSKTKETPKSNNPIDQEQTLGLKKFTLGSKSKVFKKTKLH